MASESERTVAFLINQLGVGGAERVFIADANMFARKGYKVSFFLLYGPNEKQKLASELDPSIQQYLLNASGPFDLKAMRSIIGTMRVSKTHVLISTLNDSNIIGRWCALFAFGSVRLYVREANDPFRKPRWQRILSVVFDSVSSGMIAVTEQVKVGILRDAPWRSGKITVLRNSVDVPKEVPPREVEGELKIVTVGSLTEQKDHTTLISALAELKSSGIKFRASIIGSGPLESDLKEHARKEDLTGLSFLGRLSHEDTLRAYAQADIFVLSSKWEGCPNVVLEAMAYAIPVVATAVGGVPELVQDGVTGILVPPSDPKALANALRALAFNHVQRGALGSAGRSRVQQENAPEVRFAKLERLLCLGASA